MHFGGPIPPQGWNGALAHAFAPPQLQSSVNIAATEEAGFQAPPAAPPVQPPSFSPATPMLSIEKVEAAPSSVSDEGLKFLAMRRGRRF